MVPIIMNARHYAPGIMTRMEDKHNRYLSDEELDAVQPDLWWHPRSAAKRG